MTVEVVRAQQDNLTRRWRQAEAFLDSGKPLTPRFHANLVKYEQAMTVFEAVENSLRREGYKGCIRSWNTPTKNERCNDQVVSCYACGPVDFAGRVDPVKSSHLGRDRSGKMWLIEEME